VLTVLPPSWGEGAARQSSSGVIVSDRSGFDRLDDERRCRSLQIGAAWRQAPAEGDYKSLPWTPKFSDGIEADFLAFSADRR